MTDLSRSPYTKLIRLAPKQGRYLFVMMFLLGANAYAASDEARRWRPAVDEQPSIEVANPRLNNPITPSENRRGKQIAQEADELKRATQNARGKPRPRELEALETVQPLYVEHHNEGKNADPQSRKADVVYYDYANDQAIKVVVDLNNNKIENTVVAEGAANQPFFTRAEITAAMQLIFNHPQMGTNLRKAYEKVTGQQLTDVSQLATQGGVYFPDGQSKLGRLAATCAKERCMQLFIPIDDSHFLDASNVVVNLSSGEVLWVKQGISGHSH